MLPLSRFVRACVPLLFVPFVATGAVILSVDVNDASDDPNDPAPGFVDYILADNTLSVGP